MRIRNGLTKLWCVIVAGFVIGYCQVTHSGWTGLINGVGKGWASADVRSSTLKTNRVTTFTNTALPSASVALAKTAGYITNGILPTGSATNTFSRIKGLAGGIWQATANS